MGQQNWCRLNYFFFCCHSFVVYITEQTNNVFPQRNFRFLLHLFAFGRHHFGNDHKKLNLILPKSADFTFVEMIFKKDRSGSYNTGWTPKISFSEVKPFPFVCTIGLFVENVAAPWVCRALHLNFLTTFFHMVFWKKLTRLKKVTPIFGFANVWSRWDSNCWEIRNTNLMLLKWQFI